jgi:hypothetical protein
VVWRARSPIHISGKHRETASLEALSVGMALGISHNSQMMGCEWLGAFGPLGYTRVSHEAMGYESMAELSHARFFQIQVRHFFFSNHGRRSDWISFCSIARKENLDTSIPILEIFAVDALLH